MLLGWLLRLDANGYLLLGVPIAAAFQLWVRKQPLRALWVRDAPPLRLERKYVALAVALALLPVGTILGSLAAKPEWASYGYNAVSIVGAVAAAYAFQQMNRAAWRALLLCAAINTGIDVVQWSLMFGLGVVPAPTHGPGPALRVVVGIMSLLQYIPVMFVLEEVFFRGALDAWVHPVTKAAPGKPGWLSALGVSAVWGLWHLPNSGEVSLQSTLLLLAVHCPFGMVLSYYWRRTGNLLVPGFSHALSDSIRNALLFTG